MYYQRVPINYTKIKPTQTSICPNTEVEITIAKDLLQWT